MGSLNDAGTKSGMVFAGKIRIYTRDKQDWIDLTVDSSGDLLCTNKAEETATVNLS